MTPKTWVLVAYRHQLSSPPTIVGGYATEKEAFDVGCSLCGITGLLPKEQVGAEKNGDALLSLWDSPVLLYKSVRSETGSCYPFLRKHTLYCWFDVIPGSAS